jgi:hypothetical protein
MKKQKKKSEWALVTDTYIENWSSKTCPKHHCHYRFYSKRDSKAANPKPYSLVTRRCPECENARKVAWNKANPERRKQHQWNYRENRKAKYANIRLRLIEACQD